jgi:hypothetical protein
MKDKKEHNSPQPEETSTKSSEKEKHNPFKEKDLRQVSEESTEEANAEQQRKETLTERD